MIKRREILQAGTWPDDLPPLLQRIYAARGLTSIEQAQPRLAQLLVPDQLNGLTSAVKLLMQAITHNQHILVVGDFDCDGATACAVAVRGLKQLGAKHVSYAVPNRSIHGYGLSPALVEELAPINPELLITVDHGIACLAGVAKAKALGWQVLITDHHLPGKQLPQADAIVNPNLDDDSFPSKALAGVGVMFYVLLALRAHLRELNTFAHSKEPDLRNLLDLVAVGTVADMVPLDQNNRALVADGLRQLRAGQGCVGLQTLIKISNRIANKLTTSDIGFALAPRLNAAGRLEDMNIGIELLLTDDPKQARVLASQLDEINQQRRSLQQTMTEDAEQTLGKLDAQLDGNKPIALCLFNPLWHPGVVGLVASKMKDAHYRPTIAFAPAEEGSDWLRGSARSIPGLHIRDLLVAIDAQHPGLIEKFGGHAMAAGLTLHQQYLEQFQQTLQQQTALMLDESLLKIQLLSDGQLQPQQLNRFHAEMLRDAGIWGQAFPEPLFDDVFEVLEYKIVGERHLKMTLRQPQQTDKQAAIWFAHTEKDLPNTPYIHIAYRLVPDDYRGGDAIQLQVEHCQAAAAV